METQLAFEAVRHEVAVLDDSRARSACTAMQARLLEIRRGMSATVRGVDWVVAVRVELRGGDCVLAIETLPHGGGQWVLEDARSLLRELGFGDIKLVSAPAQH